MPAFAPSHAASPARQEASSPLLAQVDRIALEQLEWLLPLWSAQDPPAYRTLAAYSRYCARSHLSALPIQPVMALKYLRTQICREEVSPYILSAVIAHLNRVYTDMADIFPENLPWRGETFEALVDEHRTTWERAEGERKASLTEDKDEPTDDEAPNIHFSGRILRHRKPTQLAQSIADLPSKPRRDKLGKRTRSYLGNSETKRQKVDDGAPPSPRVRPRSSLSPCVS